MFPEDNRLMPISGDESYTKLRKCEKSIYVRSLIVWMSDYLNRNGMLNTMEKNQFLVGHSVSLQTIRLTVLFLITNKTLSGEYTVFIHRKKKEFVPLLPKTLEELEERINHVQYKDYYMFDKKGKPFFKGIWRGPTGACVVFMSYKVLEKLRKRKSITFLMDGTFKVKFHYVTQRHIFPLEINVFSDFYP